MFLILYITLAIVLVLGISVILVIWNFSSRFMYPEYFPFNEKWSIYQNPAEIGLAYENVKFKSKDGTLLKGWYIQHYTNSPTIIFVHGRGYSKMNGLDYSNSLYDAGFNLLLFDMRNSGESKSKDSFNTMGFYEQEDVIAAVDFLENEFKITKIGVFGFSMGAASGILAMSHDKRIACGIFEGSYTSCYEILLYRSKFETYSFLLKLFPISVKLFEKRTKVIVENISPLNAISKISPRPVFLIHGINDKTVPIDHAIKLYEAAGEPKELWKTNTGHITTWYKYRDEAENRVKNFFIKWLESKLIIIENHI